MLEKAPVHTVSVRARGMLLLNLQTSTCRMPREIENVPPGAGEAHPRGNAEVRKCGEATRLDPTAARWPPKFWVRAAVYTAKQCCRVSLLTHCCASSLGPGSYGDIADTFVTPSATASVDARRAAILSKNFELELAMLTEPAPMPPPIFCIVNAPAARSRRWAFFSR